MAFPLTQVFRAVMQFRLDDKVFSVTRAYHCNSGYDAISSSSILSDELLTGVVAKLLDCMSQDVTFEGIYVAHVQQAAAMPNQLVGNSNPGTRSGDGLAPNLCMVVTLQNNASELVRPGRIYVGGLSKSDVQDGHLDAAFVTTPGQALVDELIAEINASGQQFFPVVVSSDAAGAPPVPFAARVTNSRVTGVLYSQRRRTTRQYGTKP